MVQPHRGRTNPGPAELRFLKRLGEQTYPCAIKPNHLDPVGALENRRRAVALTRLREAAAEGAFDLGVLEDKRNYRR
jgi:hypothetical protein